MNIEKKKNVDKYIFEKVEDKYYLVKQNGDSPFGYHLAIKNEIREVIKNNRIKKYHFTLFRNILEKTATYLGYKEWSNLIVGKNITDEDRKGYVRRINLFSHSSNSDFEYKELQEHEKKMLEFLFNNFIKEFKWFEDTLIEGEKNE